MQQLIKKVFSGGLNADLAEHLVPPDSFISGKNFRTWSTNIGGIGYIENPLKNAEKSHTLPAGTNTRIGTAVDDENGYIIKFNHNSNGDDGIYLYDIVGDAWYTVLMSDDVTGGLNFNKYYLINGAYVVNGMLYWNDALNEPRKLHLGAFMSAYHSSQPVTTTYSISLPIDETEITLIKRPPPYPPSANKSYNSGFLNNFIANDSFQFALRYVYFDGEDSVLSPFSKSSLFNNPNDTYNFIDVMANLSASVPQTVRLVQLIVINDLQDGKGKVGSIIKQWDRLVTAENTLINGAYLRFEFYGNLTGETIDSPSLYRPYHSVPLLSGTQEIARNRTILSDNLEGYATPGTTSLALSLPTPISTGLTSLTETIYEVRHKGNDGVGYYTYVGRYIYLASVFPVGWYLIPGTDIYTALDIPYPAIPAAPGSTTYASLIYKAADSMGVYFATSGGLPPLETETLITATTISITSISASLDVYGMYLPNSQYKAGVVFYDRYLRKCGVAYSDDTISIPSRNYAFSSGYASIIWALNTTGVIDEIPDWAYYYSVVRTLNLRTRYLVASFDDAPKYATKNSTTGLLEFTTTTFGITVVAVAINANALLQAGLGYVFAEGDECVLINDANGRYEIPVIGQEGEYILLKATDVGSLTGEKFVYEIYTPYKTSEQEPFFEFGEVYPILNPTEVTRTYTYPNGQFRADTVVLSRAYNGTTYFAQAMNPNDQYFQRWDTDAGRTNIITKLGQVRNKTGIVFSNVYIQGTQTNGLSAFEALNRKTLPEDMGTIRKLVLTSKVQKEGTVLLAIGEQETCSVYLGETQVFDSNGNSFLAKTDDFIGQINPLQGGYGTSNHESVVAHDGNVSWFSKLRGCFVSYSNQGLFPISNYGMTRVSKLFASKYASLSVGQIEALGSRPFVFGGYDPYHKEIYFSIPSTESTPPKGYLEDYVSPDYPVIYPYDIYDGIGKTLVFKPSEDKWGAPHTYQTEGFTTIRDFIFSAKSGSLWLHNVNDGTTDTFNSWYGVSQVTGIGFIVNEQPNIVKKYLTLNVEGNGITPTFCHQRTELPNVQSSDLVNEWVNREGVLYSNINRDRLSPNTTGSYNEKLYKGDLMRGQWMKVWVEYDTNKQLQVRFFNVGATLSDGHKT